MKKIIPILLSLTLILNLMTSFAMTSDNIKVFINGTEVAFDVPPQIVNGRTMVPMRAIFEALEAKIEWNSNTRTITCNKDDISILMTIDNNLLYKNEDAILLDVAPMIKDNRTLVPVRAIAETFDANVEWDEETKTVTIVTNDNLSKSNIQNSINAQNTEKTSNITDKEKQDNKPESEKQIISNNTSNKTSFDEYMNSLSSKLIAGYDTVALVKPDNTLWMWGCNSENQITETMPDAIFAPYHIMDNIETVSLGRDHTLALSTNGELYAWGSNKKGQITENTYDKVILNSIKSIAAGYDHSLAMTRDGVVYGWGDNSKLQLAPEADKIIKSPKIIAENAKEIYAAKDFSAILLNDNKLQLFGDLSNFETLLSGKQLKSLQPDYQKSVIISNVLNAEIWHDAIIVHYENKTEKYFRCGNIENIKSRSEHIDNSHYIEWSYDGEAYVEQGKLYSTSNEFPGYIKNGYILDDISYICKTESNTVLAVLSDSSIWAWGYDRNGAIGNGKSKTSNKHASTPTRIIAPMFDDVIYPEIIISEMSISNVVINDNNCLINIVFKDDKGLPACPVGMIEIKITEPDDTTYDIMKESKYFIKSNAYKDNVATLEIPYDNIKDTISGKGIIDLIFTDVNTNVATKSEIISGFKKSENKLPGKSNAYGSGGSYGGSSSGNNSMYLYYTKIINSLKQELNAVMMERNVRVYSGGKWIQTYDINKANEIKQEIAYYESLREMYK